MSNTKNTNNNEPANLRASEEQRRELARRIYHLDQITYDSIGSNLGRVFPSDKETSIVKIAHYLKYTDLEHIVQSEMALIYNMINTIKNAALRYDLLREYDSIMDEMKSITRSFESYEIISDHRDGMSKLVKDLRIKENTPLIICISRTYGSGGSQIGMELADALQINYYNAEIFKTVLARLEAEQDNVQDETFYMPSDGGKAAAGPAVPYEAEKKTLHQRIQKIFRYHGLPTRDAVFFNQSNLIVEKARSGESFVIVGRCADAILENNGIPHISFYITAPFEKRMHRIMDINHLSAKDAAKQIRKIDQGHEAYYKYFTSRRWGRASNYDICFNSAIYGLEGSKDFILRILKSNDIIDDSDVKNI